MLTSMFIKYLKTSVNNQDPSTTTDTEYLKMSDEDLFLIISICMTRDFPSVPVSLIGSIPDECVYPLSILSRKELYSILAAKDAPLYDISADMNNTLRQGSRFDHYYKLIDMTNREYEGYLDTSGSTLQSFDVLLPDRHRTRYNYEKGVPPKVLLNVDSVTDTSVDLSWRSSFSHFASYKVFISTSPIVDEHTSPKVSISPLEVIHDAQRRATRIIGLQPDTLYYVAVCTVEASGLTGYAESTFNTEVSDNG